MMPPRTGLAALRIHLIRLIPAAYHGQHQEPRCTGHKHDSRGRTTQTVSTQHRRTKCPPLGRIESQKKNQNCSRGFLNASLKIPGCFCADRFECKGLCGHDVPDHQGRRSCNAHSYPHVHPPCPSMKNPEATERPEHVCDSFMHPWGPSGQCNPRIPRPFFGKTGPAAAGSMTARKTETLRGAGFFPSWGIYYFSSRPGRGG